MVFCNMFNNIDSQVFSEVTILILIDGFLQSINGIVRYFSLLRHNPYFNRWFSAIVNQTL